MPAGASRGDTPHRPRTPTPLLPLRVRTPPQPRRRLRRTHRPAPGRHAPGRPQGAWGVTPVTRSHMSGRLCPYRGQWWTPPIAPCHASAMNGAGIALVSRRHVDLGRMSSAICPAR
ncbi:putative leader peptide [Streptomyces sp. NPDC047014]